MQGSSNFKPRTTEKTRGEPECNVMQRRTLPGVPPYSMLQSHRVPCCRHICGLFGASIRKHGLTVNAALRSFALVNTVCNAALRIAIFFTFGARHLWTGRAIFAQKTIAIAIDNGKPAWPVRQSCLRA
jgi:hypothetical protein